MTSMKKVGTVLLVLMGIYFMPITHSWHPLRWLSRLAFLSGAEFQVSAGQSLTLRQRAIGETLHARPRVTAPDWAIVEVFIINPGKHPRPRAEFRYRVTVRADAPEGVHELKIEWPNFRHGEKFLVAPRNMMHRIHSLLFLSARTVG